MEPIENYTRELDEINADMAELSMQVRSNRVARLVPIITTKGKLKGELSHLTAKQYLKYTGKTARPSITITKGKRVLIPWHLALDELATEHGYKTAEELKEGIESARDDIDKLVSLKRERNNLIDDIAVKLKRGPEVTTVKQEGQPPIYPKNETTKKEVTTLDGMEIESTRQPSYWHMEIDKTDTPEKPDLKLRVRKATDMRAMVKEAVRDKRREIIKTRLPKNIKRQVLRLAPKPKRKIKSISVKHGKQYYTKRGGGVAVSRRRL